MRWTCPHCAAQCRPSLIETGYEVTHDLRSITRRRGITLIHASGWDGSSRDVSEDGDAYWLECPKCYKRQALPPDWEINWL